MAPSPSEHLCEHAARHPDREAVVDGPVRLTFAVLEAAVEGTARALARAGVGPGDRVGMLMDNSARFVVVYLAALRAGAVVVPFNPAALPDAFTLDDAALRLLAAEERHAVALAGVGGFSPVPVLRFSEAIPGETALLRGAPEVPPCEGSEDPVVAIIYTSGTTGRPKGVMLSRSNLAATAEAGCALVGLTAEDRVGVLAPLFHLYALREVDQALQAGAALVLIKNLAFPAKALRQLADERVTVASGVPSGLALMADDRYDALLRACGVPLRALTLGTAPTPPALLQRLREAMPRTRVILTYGLTENSRACFREGADPKAGSAGRPYPGVGAVVLDENGNKLPPGRRGRVALTSAMVMRGYWRRTVLSAETLLPGGLLLTPDHGWIDAEGYVHLLGRVDDVVNTGGEKVSPEEVEAVLRAHPAVADAAVVGVADPEGILGQVLKAFVIPSNGAVTEAALRAYCAARLEPHKVPRLVAFRDAFPKTVLGKTAKALLMGEASESPTEA
jgi:acyl-CoA synthetase (AMP-forming)/AMP-acid ligase II